MKKHSVRHLTIAALLIGMGIVIPMVMPKIVIGPASFTLASHVPLFVAMFFSPGMAIAVQKNPSILLKNGKPTLFNARFQAFNLVIGLIHSIVEMLVVAVFYFTGNVPGTAFDGNFYYFLFVLMGIGGLIHSLIDYNLAYFVAGALSKQFDIRSFSSAKKLLLGKKKQVLS